MLVVKNNEGKLKHNNVWWNKPSEPFWCCCADCRATGTIQTEILSSRHLPTSNKISPVL